MTTKKKPNKPAGRPTIFGEPQEYHRVCMPISYAQFVRGKGHGNFSAGVRWAIAAAMKVEKGKDA